MEDNSGSFALIFRIEENMITQQKEQKHIYNLNTTIKLGKLDIEYSNPILKGICETLTFYKNIDHFRYIALKDLIIKKLDLISEESSR